MPQIAICLNLPGNQDEYDYVKNICLAVDDELTEDDIVPFQSFSGNSEHPNFPSFDDEFGDQKPIMILPVTGVHKNIQEVAKGYPKYILVQPLYDYLATVPSTKTLSPDRVTPLIIAGAGEDGLSGWQRGGSLVFTESSFDFDNYEISSIVDNGNGTIRVKCETLPINLAWSYFVNAFGNKIPVYIKGVTGYQFNPNGVFYPVGESYYTNDTTNWVDITHTLGTGSYSGSDGRAGFNYLSGAVAVIGAKLNRIRRRRGCSFDEAIAVAKLTSSHPARDDNHGYGSINVVSAISYSGRPNDESGILGEIGELNINFDDDGYGTFSMEEVVMATSIKIYRNGVQFSEVAMDYGAGLNHRDRLPPGEYTARGFRLNSFTELSNSVTVELVPLENKPEKSKYTIGDQVLYRKNGNVREATITGIIIYVDSPDGDRIGRQMNFYNLENFSAAIHESELFTSMNHLLATLKGNYINADETSPGEGDGAYYVPGLDGTSFPITFSDAAGLELGGLDLLTAAMEFHDGLVTDGTNFEGSTLPTNVDTKAEFKAVVKSYDKDTTIWTDGEPIGI